MSLSTNGRRAAQVRMVFADYYSCTDTRDTTKSLGVFLEEAIAALELGSHSSTTGAANDSVPSPARLASRLKARLLESSEQLTYHLDGDDPMVLHRFWMRFVLVSNPYQTTVTLPQQHNRTTVFIP